MRYTISFRKLWFIVAVYIAMDLLCITFHDYLPEWFQFTGTEESLAKDLNVAWFVAGAWLFFRERSPE